MAFKGKKFTIHGAFASKKAAKRKERQVGGFIVERTIKGSKRFVVLKSRGKNKRKKRKR